MTREDRYADLADSESVEAGDTPTSAATERESTGEAAPATDDELVVTISDGETERTVTLTDVEGVDRVSAADLRTALAAQSDEATGDMGPNGDWDQRRGWRAANRWTHLLVRTQRQSLRALITAPWALWTSGVTGVMRDGAAPDRNDPGEK